MIISFVRTLLLYVLVISALRIMGKRQVGELQPGELVVAIMISDLGAIPLGDTSLPLGSGVVPILTLIGAELVLSIISLKSDKVRRILTGTPSVIIKNGIIQAEEMRKNRYNLEDLAEGLREKDCYDVSDVHTAILETNGSLSVILKGDKRPIKAEDINLPFRQETLPYVLIADGKVYPEHLTEAGVSRKWLDSAIRKQGGKRAEDFFLLTLCDGKVFAQLKEDNNG